MSTPRHPSIRQYNRAEPYEADKLIGDTCDTLHRLGVRISLDKVKRMVRRYVEHVAHTGYPLADWITAQLALHADRRARVRAELARVLWYADPTGETAVSNVMAGR